MHHIIQEFNRIEPLDDKEVHALENLLATARQTILKKGEYLWQYGDMPDYEAYIEHGLLRQVIEDSDGNEKIIQFYKEGDYIHDCTGQPVNHCIHALEDCTLGILKNTDWENLLRRYPKIERIGYKMLQQLLHLHKDHLNLLMKYSPEERYKYVLQNQPELVSRVSVTHMAQYLGLSRETLSRMRAKVSEYSTL